jgi:RimJ/RimL family protein N-acetyltransferase
MDPSVLLTKRLIIRRLVAQDAKTVSFYRSLPEVARFQSWDKYSIQEASELIAACGASEPCVHGRWFQFGVTLKDSGELIGDVGFLNTDERQRSWIGFTLNSIYWGQGYAIESVAAVLEYYSGLGSKKVWASIDPMNHPSEKLLRKLAFQLHESRPQDHVYVRLH